MRIRMIALSLIVAGAIALVLGGTTTAYAEGEATADAWRVRSVLTPGVVPSFITADNGRIAWTGVTPGPHSRMFVFNLSAGSNVAITNGPSGDYYNPCADGAWVAFQGKHTGAYDDIYLYDTQNATVQQITYNTVAGDENDWDPRMDSGRIVWQKNMVGSAAKPGIYMYDVSTEATALIIPGKEYRDPDIWGDYIVCVKNVSTGGTTGSAVVLYNMVTRTSVTIAEGTSSNEHPRIDAGRVVWSSGDLWMSGVPYPWPTFQVKLYDIASGATTVLTNDIAGNLNPSIEGDLVAWETKQPSMIQAYELATEVKVQVSQGGDTARSPEVDGGTIAWFGNKGLYSAIRASEATRFPDVPAGHHYAVAIEGMAAKDIIAGYDSGYFGPNDLVTRQQFAKMIVLTMGFIVTESDVYDDFTDLASIVHTAGKLYPYHYVAKAALTGLTTGYPDGTFRPLANISRQQVITMIVRAGSQVLLPPKPPSYKGVLSYSNSTHGQNIRLAEFNHLLDGIIGPNGKLESWSTTGYATRAEVAQMLWNLLGKLPPTG